MIAQIYLQINIMTATALRKKQTPYIKGKMAPSNFTK